MRIRTLAAATTVALLLAGCSTAGDQSSPAQSPVEQSPAAQSPTAAATDSPQTSPSVEPSPSASEEQTSGTKEITAADGALTFTMPCAKPKQDTFKGNANDQKRYVGGQSWTCGAGTKTSENTAVFMVELRKPPADDDAAHRELQGAAEEVLQGAKPKHTTFQGHPSVSLEISAKGREGAMQGVSFGPYLVLFAAVPAENLSEITDTVTIKE